MIYTDTVLGSTSISMKNALQKEILSLKKCVDVVSYFHSSAKQLKQSHLDDSSILTFVISSPI